MKIKTIYNFQETCISCTLQCQEHGATGRQLSFKLCTAIYMYLCIFNKDQYPKYILSYLILFSIEDCFLSGSNAQKYENCKNILQIFDLGQIFIDEIICAAGKY